MFGQYPQMVCVLIKKTASQQEMSQLLTNFFDYITFTTLSSDTNTFQATSVNLHKETEIVKFFTQLRNRSLY